MNMNMKRRDFIKSVATVAVVGLPTGAIAADKPGQPASPSRLALPRRALGRTGAEVSVLALGGVIGMQIPPSHEHDPVTIAETALNLGITYFDTAPGYNNGQSESNYGQVLARRRKEVFLATKTGDRTHDGTLRSIEQSLKRLRTDHVDLIQIHGVSGKEDLDTWEKPTGVLTALRKLRDQKVTRFIGLTGHDSASRLREAIERYEFDTILTTFNPVSRRRPYREDLLPVAVKKEMGIIAMKLMGGGNGCLVKGNPLKQVLRPYHDDTSHQVDPAALIRYVMGLPISVGVVGVSSVEQLHQNVRIVKDAPPMTAAEQRQLEELMG